LVDALTDTTFLLTMYVYSNIIGRSETYDMTLTSQLLFPFEIIIILLSLVARFPAESSIISLLIRQHFWLPQ